METTSVKTEILNDLKELKDKGVGIGIYDSYLDRSMLMRGLTIHNGGTFTINNNIISGNDTEQKVVVLKKASELAVHIYLNSTEEEIKSQISAIKNHLATIEKDSKSSAIVDFLKEELK